MRIQSLLQFPLRFWHRWLSPMLPPMCRFYPNCSVYAVEALDRHPLHRALWLILKRVGKCHPLHPGGYDPVPGSEDDEACCRHHAGATSGRAAQGKAL